MKREVVKPDESAGKSTSMAFKGKLVSVIMLRRIGVSCEFFEIIENRVEVRDLGDVALGMGVAKIAHKPAGGHR